MIVVIRIDGRIGVERSKREAMERLMLRHKYNCILLPEKEMEKVFNIKDKVMYGSMDEKTLKMLLAARGKKDNKPLTVVKDELVKALLEDRTTMKKEGLKPYFRLHPPRGGWKKSLRLAYPRGVLAKNDQINEWIVKML